MYLHILALKTIRVLDDVLCLGVGIRCPLLWRQDEDGDILGTRITCGGGGRGPVWEDALIWIILTADIDISFSLYLSLDLVLRSACEFEEYS